MTQIKVSEWDWCTWLELTRSFSFSDHMNNKLANITCKRWFKTGHQITSIIFSAFLIATKDKLEQI